MKVGILELKEYGFVQDVARKVSEKLDVEYICMGEISHPPEQRYRVILDRLSFQDPYLRQAMMLASLGGCYVMNNPFSSSLNNKMTSHMAAEGLGIKQPATVFLPMANDKWDLCGTVKDPSWDEIKKKISLPCIMKPYDGFAWEDVYTVTSYKELENLYNSIKARRLMIVQEKIDYAEYFRVFCVNKQDVLITKWKPKPSAMGEYSHPDQKTMDKYGERIRSTVTRINSVLDYDFNAVECCIDYEGELYIIDSMNEVPDIDRKFIPEDQYEWLVEKVSGCIIQKFGSGEQNRNVTNKGQL